MTQLFVSPHLDDAAWSCAGAILQRDSSVVCTVFARGQDERRREDAAALAHVGVRSVHLDIEDDVTVRPPPSFRALVLDPEPDPSVVDAIAHAVRRVADDVRAHATFFPLGIGGHVDHRAVFLASLGFAGARYYEDRPYAFVPALVQLRRLELEGGRADAPPSPAAIDGQITRGGCDALFEPGERDACVDALAAALRAHHRGLDVRLVDEQVARHDPRVTARALELVRAYASQLDWLAVNDRVAELWAPEGALVERTFAVSSAAE